MEYRSSCNSIDMGSGWLCWGRRGSVARVVVVVVGRVWRSGGNGGNRVVVLLEWW